MKKQLFFLMNFALLLMLGQNTLVAQNQGDKGDDPVVKAKATNTWDGSTNHYWADPNNWSLNHVPTDAEDVVIPNVNSPVIVDFWDAECNNLTINSGVHLRVMDQDLSVHASMTIHGELEMLDQDSKLFVYGNIVWESGSTANITSPGAIMYISGSWNFNSGSTVHLNNGGVYFHSSSNSWIRSYSTSSYFFRLASLKNGSDATNFSNLSTADLVVSEYIWVPDGNNFKSYSNHNIVLSGHLYARGNVDLTAFNNTGTLVFNGNYQMIDFDGTGSLIASNVNFNASTGVSSNDAFEVKGNLTINSGYFNPNDHTITVGGNWNNIVGDAGFVEGSGKVVFNGNSHQYCSDEIFNDLEVDKSGGAFRLNGADVVCAAYDWTAGAIDVLSGSFTANSLTDNGIAGAYYLNTGGEINLHNPGGYVDLSGDLHIFGGTMNVYDGSFPSYWPYMNDASIEMSGGVLDFHDQGIYINNNSLDLDDNITGGVIRMRRGFSGNRADFAPAGGTFELYGSVNYYMYQSNGCTLYDVEINKSAKSGESNDIPQLIDKRSGELLSDGGKSNTISLGSDFVVTHNLTVNSGTLKLDGNTLTVMHDCDVYGTLTMDDVDDVFNVGSSLSDFLSFYSGSYGNFSQGVTNMRYGMETLAGSSFTATTDHTLHFVGNLFAAGIMNEEPSTVYGNIDVDKTGGAFYLSYSSTAPYNVSGDFTLHASNYLRMGDNSMTVHGNFTDEATSEIYVYEVSKGAKNAFTKSSNGTKAKGGSLEIDNDFTLHGFMNVNDGNVLAHGRFHTASGSNLSITSGSLTCDYTAGGGWSTWSGNYSLSSGLIEFLDSHFKLVGTSNFTGGTIRIGRSIWVETANAFQQNGGITEAIGSNAGNYISFSSGSYINDFLFNKTVEYPTMEDLTINGDVNINSGIFRCNNHTIYVGGDWTNAVGASAFDEGTGKVVLDGTGDLHINNPEVFYNLTLDRAGSGLLIMTDDLTVEGDLLINDGTIRTGDHTLDVQGDVNLESGTVLFTQAGGTLKVGGGKSLTAALGSHLYIEGSSVSQATLTHSGSGRFDCDVFGEIAANYATFEYMTQNGLYLHAGSTVNTAYDFNHCIFQNGSPAKGSAYLVINSSSTVTAEATHFDNSAGNVGNNVWKNMNTGEVTFHAATGNFAGTDFEYDPHNRIHWTDIDIELHLSALLEGAYNGVDMNTSLKDAGVLPLSQPFNQWPWEYSGTESVAAIPANVVDWVLVQLRDADTPANADEASIFEKRAAFLLNDGSIVDLDGVSPLHYTTSYDEKLYPVVFQYNHLAVITPTNITRNSFGNYAYDFRDGAYGGALGEKEVAPGVWAMIGGDSFEDGIIDSNDIGEWKWTAGSSYGYHYADMDMNGYVDNKDKNDICVPNFGAASQVTDPAKASSSNKRKISK